MLFVYDNENAFSNVYEDEKKMVTFCVLPSNTHTQREKKDKNPKNKK